jgi:hypothetical protein
VTLWFARSEKKSACVQGSGGVRWPCSRSPCRCPRSPPPQHRPPATQWLPSSAPGSASPQVGGFATRSPSGLPRTDMRNRHTQLLTAGQPREPLTAAQNPYPRVLSPRAALSNRLTHSDSPEPSLRRDQHVPGKLGRCSCPRQPAHTAMSPTRHYASTRLRREADGSGLVVPERANDLGSHSQGFC